MRTTETPQETADDVARKYFDVSDDASRSKTIKQFLFGDIQSAIIVPLLFLLRFREVGPLGWGTTVFFVVYCLLAAIGLYFGPKTDFHTSVRLRGDLVDKIGAFWLVGCVFGPFPGWIVTSGLIPITTNSWHWLYVVRIALAAGIPVLLALPMTRYIRGRSTLVALPILIVVTLLPVSTVMNASFDLKDGPIVRPSKAGKPEIFLTHTEQSLGPVIAGSGISSP